MQTARCKRVEVRSTGCIPVTVMTIGGMDNHCYIVSDGQGEGAPSLVIDPTGDVPAILKAVGKREVSGIFCTHKHSDHTTGLPDLVAATGAPVIAGIEDVPDIEGGRQRSYYGETLNIPAVKVDMPAGDGDVLAIGTLEFQVIHTPGHTKGGLCLYLPGFDGKPGIVFTGDTLFQGTTGRTDFEGGSRADMRWSLRSQLAQLPDDTIVFPGHEGLTTIGLERKRTIEAY